MPEQSSYFARTTHGLEEFTWQDIRQYAQAELKRTSHRTIEFSSAIAPEQFLHLRSAEDLFAYAGNFNDIGHERSALALIRSQVKKMKIEASLKLIKQAREISNSPSYSISASFVGSRNYNRWEIAEAVKAALPQSWRYIENREQSTPAHDINVRVVLEEKNGILGLRLADSPLYKRA